jgi:hypothetical protein
MPVPKIILKEILQPFQTIVKNWDRFITESDQFLANWVSEGSEDIQNVSSKIISEKEEILYGNEIPQYQHGFDPPGPPEWEENTLKVPEKIEKTLRIVLIYKQFTLHWLRYLGSDIVPATSKNEFVEMLLSLFKDRRFLGLLTKILTQYCRQFFDSVSNWDNFEVLSEYDLEDGAINSSKTIVIPKISGTGLVFLVKSELFIEGALPKNSKYAKVQKLLTQADKTKLPKLYSQENIKDPVVYVKFFNPYGDGTWLATEFDGQDTFFGYVKLHGDGELGYFSLRELENLKAQIGGKSHPGIQGIERDQWFKPAPLSKAKHMASSKTAIDKYNVPEMLAALLGALETAGLKDTVMQLKSRGFTKIINDAWMSKKKK